MKRPPYRIEDLLPHARPMIFLDEVTGIDEGTLSAALTVRPGILFFEAGRGVAAHIAIEWMAQACGAYAGIEARQAEQPVRIGFLLGTRDFQATVPWFLEGERLNVKATLTFRDSEMAVFNCVVTSAASGDELAKASLTLYLPDDATTLVAAQAAARNQ